MEKLLGTVKWFDNAKGFGFILNPDGEDVFVHYRSIQREGYKTLSEGEQVEFLQEINKDRQRKKGRSAVAAAVSRVVLKVAS